MSTPSPLLLVIADPAASFVKSFLPGVPPGVRALVADIPEELKAKAPEVDAILYAHGQPALLSEILPLAQRLRWIHSLWTGVEVILIPEMLKHPRR